MRNFATLQSITDLQGYPITGDRLYFYTDETTLATITDAEGTELENPQRIVNGHTEKQVFLPDTDIRIVQKTCVDAESDTWDNVAVWIDKAPAVAVSVSGGIASVDTIEELRTLDTAVGLVELRGYSAAGDKPAIYYKWDATCNYTDCGIYVKSSVYLAVTGRWVAVMDSDYIDVRHFGIFPQAGRTESQGTEIASAYNIARISGKNLYFPMIGSLVNYEIGGCTIEGALFDFGSRVFALSNDARLQDCENAYAYGLTDGGKVYIESENLRTTQNVNTSGKVYLLPSKSIRLESDYGLQSAWDGVQVIISHELTKEMSFTNCTFSGTAKIKASSQIFSFTDCHVKQSMFDDACDYDYLEFSNCYSEFSEWSGASKYIKFCQLNGSPVIDLNGKTVSETTSITGTATIRNATFAGGLTLADATNITLENVTAIMNAGKTAALTLDRATLNHGDTAQTLTVTYMANVSQSIVKVVLHAVTLTANASTFDTDVTTSGAVGVSLQHGNLNGCVFGQCVNVRDDSLVFGNIVVSGCVFNGTSHMALQGDSDTTYSVSGLYILNCVMNGTTRQILDGLNYAGNFENFAVNNNTNATTVVDTSSSKVNKFEWVDADRIVIRKGAALNNVNRLQFSSYLTNPAVGNTYQEGELALFLNSGTQSVTYSNARQYQYDTTDGSVQIVALTLRPYAAVLAVYSSNGYWMVTGTEPTR